MVALGIGLILSAAIGGAFGQSGADALFFARSGTDALPVMLLISGALMFVTSIGLTAMLARVPQRRLFLALPLGIAGVVLVERALVAADLPWIYPVLWLTTGVGQLVQGIFTWGMYGMVVDTRQAKRLFPLFGAGWILGWVVGGLSTRPLATAIGAENLLFVWAGGLVATFAFGRVLLGRARASAPRRRSSRPRPGLVQEMQQGVRAVRASPVMRWMSLAALLFSVLFYFLYLPFSQAATERFPDADALAGFFGLFSAVTAAAALLWSVFVTGRLFSRFGVTTMQLMLPLIYLVGFAILAVHSVFVTVVVVRFAQMLWIQAVANPAWEAVINVVPPVRRDQARTFLNGVPYQAGTVIAGVVQVVGTTTLSPTQLSAIGVAAAALTTYACVRVRRSYAAALVDALRAGRPQVFPDADDVSSPLGHGADATAVAALVAGAGDPDVRVRRTAVDLLGELASEDAAGALRRAARDEDATVRAAALRAAARAGHPPDPATVSLALSDPDATVRTAAIHAVGSADDGSAEPIRGALQDDDAAVRAAAAAALLRSGPDREATSILRGMLGASDPDERVLAIEGLGGAGSGERADLLAAALSDPAPRVRAAAARALGPADPEGAVAALLGALDDPDPTVRAAVASGLGAVGESAVDPVVSALSDPDRAEAALAALEVLPVTVAREQILDHARGQAASATADFDVARAIRFGGDGDGDDEGARLLLLRDSLIDRARRRARTALRAMALAGDRESSAFVIDNLSSRDPAQVANALEALEAAGDATVVRPLLRLWEPAVPLDTRREVWLGPLLGDPDPWIRGCAELLDDAMEGAPMTEVPAALSDMERVLFLRKVSLFADLPPRDLSRVAAIAEERTYTDGETIAEQGERGDELHIVVAGTVRVLRSEPPGPAAELARRTQGEVVGEMALITQEPRMASLLASGDVRTLRVGRVEFEGVLRERPDTAIAVIRVLSQRLVESAGSG